jgi:hypothetical protein
MNKLRFRATAQFFSVKQGARVQVPVIFHDNLQWLVPPPLMNRY